MSSILDNPALLIVLLALLAIPVVLLLATFLVGSRATSRHGSQALGQPMTAPATAQPRGRTSRDIILMLLMAVTLVAPLLIG